MLLKVFKNTVLFSIIISISLVTFSCGQRTEQARKNVLKDTLALNDAPSTNRTLLSENKNLNVGANKTQDYLPLLQGKRVGIVANQTSVIFKTKRSKASFLNYTHLVDSLIAMNVDVKKVFAPEHGFRGVADAGEVVKDGLDTKTGLPIISLYGKNKKPTAEQLKGLDLIIFDIQDVGARFYTYISSLHYVMEACAEQNIPVLVLDRPNPNGHYIDGPILEKAHKSFVGMHPIPVVHGMTIGEYAQMINGEHWLTNGIQCQLTVITVDHYNHQLPYKLPINPSPNLPNAKAINLYPSLCFFEGTPISVGRGTNKQFQVIGSPKFKNEGFPFQFTPTANAGAKYPKHDGEICYGYDLSEYKTLDGLNLEWLIDFYNKSQTLNSETPFFTDFFTLLAGTQSLEKQIVAGWSEKEIRASWKAGLTAYSKTRAQYLLYP